jgi:murein DD-endopeptidase MepM/ murein hydrolase activator NlpD
VPAALAQSGGGGGAMFVAKPELARVTCVRRCASRGRAQGGSTLRLTGRGLGAVARVVFQGSRGRGDDASAAVGSRSSRRVSVRVPYGAVTGPLSAVTDGAVRSRPTPPIAILPPPPPTPSAELTPVPGQSGPFRVETGTSRTKAFVGARRAVTFSFRVSGAAPAVSVELVRASDGASVRTWHPPAAPGTVETVSWDGRLRGSGARPGRYSFRLTAGDGSGATVRSAQAGEAQRDAFDLYDNMFPIRGRHDFGSGGGRFGAGRAGHSHQGQDVFARCGTPLVAARGGRVRFKQYHAAAGNYLVVDGAGTGTDYVYMHLAEPSPFSAGDRVYTGQRIGAVGDTGNARGCHLHFELWGAPGWYDGGRPFDPLSALRAWDSWS